MSLKDIKFYRFKNFYAFKRINQIFRFGFLA
jgi:hypothetical protein